METLSKLATFDDLRRRCEVVLTDGRAEVEFLSFAQMQENNRKQWLNAVKEAQRLQRELDVSLKNVACLESKLYHARRLLEVETKCRKEVEKERDATEKKMWLVRDLLRNEVDLNEETRDKFAFLNSCQKKRRSKKPSEKYGNDVNSTGSFLSDLSVTQSEDDLLDVPQATNRWKKHRPSYTADEAGAFIGAKRSRISFDGKRRSNIKQNNDPMEIDKIDKIVASTRVSIPQGNGPITAESIIEAIPTVDFESKTPKNHLEHKRTFMPSAPPSHEINYSKVVPDLPYKQCGPIRQHSFGSRTFLKSDICLHCQKKIRFGTVSLKCRDCRVCVHPDCKHLLTVVCVPQSVGTPTTKGIMGVIADYAPSNPPMVPGIIVHCINEIEGRGLNEVGIYRVSGSEKDIKALKDRFIRGKSTPSLANIDVHVLCGCIKDFLRNLREPLIPTSLWKDFSNAAQNTCDIDSMAEMYKAIHNLPMANRDTLAFLMQHFLRVANASEVKMPASNIAKVFGPTIIGYSSADPNQHAIFTETMIQANVMEKLLSIPTEYWNRFLKVADTGKYTECERDYGAASNQYFGTPSFRNTTRKPKLFSTPPYSTVRKK